MPDLTDKQARVLDYLREQWDQSSTCPTIREMASALGFKNINGVVGHLEILQREGYITRTPGKSRSIRLTELAQPESGLPVAGQVAAGAMTAAIEQQDRIDFSELFGRGDFVLKVVGDSMIDAHIMPGDFVVVKKQSTADRGDMAVVRDDDGDATLKYWYPEKNRIRLQPANETMQPIYRKHVTVIGVVMGVVRKYDG